MSPRYLVFLLAHHFCFTEECRTLLPYSENIIWKEPGYALLGPKNSVYFKYQNNTTTEFNMQDDNYYSQGTELLLQRHLYLKNTRQSSY